MGIDCTQIEIIIGEALSFVFVMVLIERFLVFISFFFWGGGRISYQQNTQINRINMVLRAKAQINLR